MEKKEALINIGYKIRSIREEKGISQADLGRMCDIEPQNMYRIEAGKTNVTIETLLKISNQLSISVKALIDF